MKTYIKPSAEILELTFDEKIMASLDSGDWGIEDGSGGGWEE